jgi:hypothetical protein
MKQSISAAVRIQGELLDPNLVTECLQVEPTLAFKKGDRIIRPGSKRKFGQWVLETKSDVDELDCFEQLAKLLEPSLDSPWLKKQSILDILGVEIVMADVFVCRLAEKTTDEARVKIGRRLLAILAQLDIPLVLTAGIAIK